MKDSNKNDYYFNKINHHIGKTIIKYDLIHENDKILVAVSGGKDSLTLLYFLKEFQKKSPIKFEIIAFHLEQGQPGEDSEPLKRLLESWHIPYYIEYRNTYKIVLEKTKPDKIYCSLCSRLRRGIIENFAQSLNCNAIALGHHRDDVIETLLLNMFFAGKISTMKPIYFTKKNHIKIIRPLYSVEENWISEFVKIMQWELLPCNLCNNITNSQRKNIKYLLEHFKLKYPNIKNSIFSSIEKMNDSKTPLDLLNLNEQFYVEKDLILD